MSFIELLLNIVFPSDESLSLGPDYLPSEVVPQVGLVFFGVEFSPVFLDRRDGLLIQPRSDRLELFSLFLD